MIVLGHNPFHAVTYGDHNDDEGEEEGEEEGRRMKDEQAQR
jgi:hypothetical protein